jgi:hypothetical protein
MTKYTKDIVYMVAIVIALLAALTVLPFVTILALNTLFLLGIPFNFYTWAAMVWLNIVVLAPFKTK